MLRQKLQYMHIYIIYACIWYATYIYQVDHTCMSIIWYKYSSLSRLHLAQSTLWIEIKKTEINIPEIRMNQGS